MEDKDPQRAWVRALGLFGVIVADLIGYTGAGVALGYLAWTKLGAPVWVPVITSLLGFSLAIYRLYQRSSREL